jgi:hypothetical protein
MRRNIGSETMKVILRMVLVVLAFVCVGCSGGVHKDLNITGDSGGSKFSEIGKYSGNHPPILYAGSKFIYRHISPSDGQSGRVTMEVKERKLFEHKEAYWVDVTGKGMRYFNIYDMNLNWIGLFGDGKELESAEPCLQVFRWPLTIGEKWKSAYTFRDYSDYSHGVQVHTSKVDVNMQDYEEVRVPAGTFKALRIQAGRETFWYAPSIGWIVKEALGLDDQNRRILELVEYRIPRNM